MRATTTSLSIALFLTCLAGCGYASGATCVDWVRFETPQEKFDQAELVIVGSGTERDGTESIYDAEAHSYRMDVAEVLKGELPSGTVRVSSMPVTCTAGSQYPEGDPLDGASDVLIFANRHEGEWFTLTPFDGVLPYSEDIASSLIR
ncbi:hypothetical protein [Arthrobacter sedimenti]|uniref:hypothetical protein n=1 Tax=Arthrobacter sedimenti TaxID=2694931 RepID=UPI000B35FCE4|nr:hypothetical protein [Arthrobacter sedimenti]OUM42701.1 hypothetical protein B8W73_07720 [Arthrobacter agilis]